MPTFQGECEGVGRPGGAGRHWPLSPPRVGWHSCGAWLLPHHIASRGWGTSQDLRGWGCKAADSSVLPFLPVSNLFQAVKGNDQLQPSTRFTGCGGVPGAALLPTCPGHKHWAH